jgi:peptidoglycan hydrolase CwlO-like protein
VRYLTLFLLIFFGWGGSVFLASAQTSTAVEERRAELQQQLDQEEKLIQANLLLLGQKQKDTATVKGEVDLLKAEIAAAQNKIKAKKLEIERLGDTIEEHVAEIGVLDSKIKRGQESLSELLRQTRNVDSASLVEIALDNQSLSNFFGDVNRFQLVERSVQDLFAEIRESQTAIAAEKKELEDKQNKELDAQKQIEYEQKLVKQKETERSYVLSLHQKEADAYAKIVAERQKRAANIRAALFSLRDSAAIPFGKALEFATTAAAKTGIRPAFLLAILQQESNLGANVGTCNRPGDPPSKSWKAVMKASRDQAPFLRITSELGLNPDTVPVSCPIAGVGGYGGGMGPAQFIPSTWELYKAKLAALLGHTPNPWEPQDAFMASAVYLSELVGGRSGYSAEREAALRYYAGANWNKSKNAFYGNQVMSRAENIQLTMINPLQNS